MKTNTELLQDFLEANEFIVHLYEQDGIQCAEIEKWTDGGVDMNLNLNPFSKEEFINVVKNFDIDDEIMTNRQDSRYCADFTLTQSLKDFTKFHKKLKKVALNLLKRNDL